MSVEARLKELGIDLPEAPAPAACYIPARKVGNLLFVAGQGPRVNNQEAFTGKIGAELTLEDGQAAARLCAINLLAAAKTVVGSLDRIKSVVKVLVFVSGVPGFAYQHLVANGASELLVQVFGEAGRHPRAAVGAADLPLGTPVEVEAIFEIAE